METPDPSSGPGLHQPPAGVDPPPAPVVVEELEVGGDDPVDSDLDEFVAPDAAPTVVAVLVTSDPGPWLEDDARPRSPPRTTRRSPSSCSTAGRPRTRRPGSRRRCPERFVRRLAQNVGFAAAANDALTAVEGATFLLFCHDDVALEPRRGRRHGRGGIPLERRHRRAEARRLRPPRRPARGRHGRRPLRRARSPASSPARSTRSSTTRSATSSTSPTPRCSCAPTCSTSSAASIPRRSPAPTTSTSAGGPGSPARACSSRRTRASGTDARPCRTIGRRDATTTATCGRSPRAASVSSRKSYSGLALFWVLPIGLRAERRRGGRARSSPAGRAGPVRCSRVGSPRSRRAAISARHARPRSACAASTTATCAT